MGMRSKYVIVVCEYQFYWLVIQLLRPQAHHENDKYVKIQAGSSKKI